MACEKIEIYIIYLIYKDNMNKICKIMPIKCIDCFQEVISVTSKEKIKAPLRNKEVDLSNAFCEGCFKYTIVNYMCPWGHFMCKSCSNFDPDNKCEQGPLVESITKTFIKNNKDVKEVCDKIQENKTSK